MFDNMSAMERAGELIESIRTTTAELLALDVSDVAVQDLGALLQQIEAARAIVDAAASSIIDQFDRQGAAAYDGLRTTNAWLRQRCHMTSATASRRVRTARALRELPEITQGFHTGRFSADQVDLFARNLNPRTSDAMAQDEAALATLADHLTADQLARELRGWAELVDTDGAEPDPGHHNRSFTFVQTLDDSWTGRLDLSAADGLFLNQAVDGMAETLRHLQESGSALPADHPESSDQPDPARTRTQRRADALLELVRRGCGHTTSDTPTDTDTTTDTTVGSTTDTGSTAQPGPRRSAPRVTLYLTLEAGDLEAGRGADTLTGHHLNPTATDRLLCDCALTRVLLDPLDGATLDFGRRRRLVSPAQRSALALRDGGCSFPGCNVPPQDCDAHHIIHWRRGGPTALHNLALACHHHHTLVHDEGWQLTMTASGPRWSRPDRSQVPHRPGWVGEPSDPSTSRSSVSSRRLGRPPDRSTGPPDRDDPEVADLVRRARERVYALRLTA